MNLVSGISVLHPSLAVAALAAGLIPLVIHLINRRRHRRVPWAAMAFLLTAARRRARRTRLEQWFLFAARVLAITLFGLAVARPYVIASPFLPVGPSHFHRIILLDDSASMGASTGEGATTYDQARQVVSTLVDSFSKTDEVSIVSLAAPATPVIDSPSLDRRRIRDALARLPLTQRGTDPAGGFARALDLLKESSAAPNNRCVYVISDLAGGAWSGENKDRDERTPGRGDEEPHRATAQATSSVSPWVAARAVAQRAALILVPVGDPAAANAGVADLALASTVTAAKVPVRFATEVVNYGMNDVRHAVLQVRRGERVERRITLPTLEPGQAESVTFSVVFDAAGPHALHAHLDAGPADRLALDNDRWLAVDVTEGLKVLVVDGAPGRTRLAGQAGYLLTALNPWSPSTSAGIVSPKAISDLELGGEILSAYQVVVLCNVERLDDALWRRLREYVEDGGGLLVFAGESINVDNYNRLGHDGGNGVLPGALQPAEGDVARDDSVEADLGFLRGEMMHPVIADFEGLPTSGLFAARVWRRMPIKVDDAAAEIVLRYTDQSPAVALRQRGAGRCCFVTTSADMAWNNLPAKGDYVSLMMNLVAYLAQPQTRGRNLEVGGPIARPLAAGASSLPLRVRLPSGENTDASLSVVDGGFELVYADTERAGLYTTLVGSGAQTVAVNPPRAESDLQRIEQTALAEAVDAPFTTITDLEDLRARASAPGARELGSEIIYAVLILLMCETWLATRQGRARETARRPAVRATTRGRGLSIQHSGPIIHDA